MGYTKAQLEAFLLVTVPDLIGPGCSLLFVGINPGLWTAATQTHFCHPSNRFYPALRASGLIDFKVDTDLGMTAEQRTLFTSRGMGISNLVQRATVRASELSREELIDGGTRLRRFVDDLSPRVVAVAGVTAYRTAFSAPKAQIGEQKSGPNAGWWVLPNPSGLNAHVTIDGLADWFSLVAREAGVL